MLSSTPTRHARRFPAAITGGFAPRNGQVVPLVESRGGVGLRYGCWVRGKLQAAQEAFSVFCGLAASLRAGAVHGVKFPAKMPGDSPLKSAPMCSHVEFADVYAYVISAEGNGLDIARADWERPKRCREEFARLLTRRKDQCGINLRSAQSVLNDYRRRNQ